MAASSNANQLVVVEEAADQHCVSAPEMASSYDDSGEQPKEAEDELVARQQAARTYLRQQFLWCMAGLAGHDATFHMHEKTTVKGTFRCCDIEVQHFGVSDLLTALGCQPAAILRAGDVISFTVSNLDMAAGCSD